MGLFRIDLLAPWLLLIHMATAAAPVPTKDGFCFKYIIQGYDTCALIAQKHGITAADIESFNKDTWAWLGCRQLYQGDFICLSAGKPPMPMALPQATCGPQVPGTVRPSKWSDLAGLNPCASSKCCAFWGQCGVSGLYCQKPGYRAPPAGPTATVKGATEAPKSPSTEANTAGKPAGTGANSKSSAQSKTTKANTLKDTTTASRPSTTKTTTSKKTTTKTTEKWTPEPTVSQYPWNPPWQITMYSDLNCKGDYYHLEGYNHKFLDEKGCLAIHGGINSKFTETGVTCKWFTDDGLTWKSCDVGTLKKPKSWNVKNGFCKAFSKANCDCSDNWSLYYRSQGCYNGAKKDHLPQWEALQCSIDGF